MSKTKPQFVTINTEPFTDGQAVIYQADGNKFVPSDGSTLLTLAGDWATDTFYGVDYIVTHNGSSYASKVAHTSSDGTGSGTSSGSGTGTGSGSFDDEPGVGADWGTYWQLIAEGADTSNTVLLTTDQTIGGTKTFSNSPVIPTPTTGDNTTKAASTAFVKAAIDAMIDGAPGALDTLKELADALGDDANYAATITTALAGKLAIASNLSDLDNAGTARTNLGLGTAATKNVPATGDAAAGEVVLGNDSRLTGGGSGTGSGSSGGAWGSITGTLSDQTDLQSALDAKAADSAVVKLTGDQTVAGIKTLSSFAITPSSAPTTDYQVANKKYVDDNTGGGGSVDIRDVWLFA